MMRPRQAMRRMRSPIAGAIAAALFGIACSTDPLGDALIGVVDIEVSGVPADGVLLLGSSRTLTAEAIGPGGVVLEDREIEWRSVFPAVATVSETGRVEAVDEGETTILALSEGLTRHLSISVRQGTTVPNSGPPRTATLLEGLLRLSVPAGVATSGTVIHARPATNWPANSRVLDGTVIEIGPDGTELGNAITVGITFIAADIPATERPLLRLHALNAAEQWVELPNGTVDLANSRVSGAMIRLGKVAIFRAPP